MWFDVTQYSRNAFLLLDRDNSSQYDANYFYKRY